ncbi:MAG: DUF72 domain-containing protein [Myxococcota bacterium]
MLFVACSGFPVPVSRYWGLFPAVEISDTELGIPGAGTVRRWLRESPDGFAFTALAPKALGESGFRRTKENAALVEEFAEFSKTLGAQAIVLQAPPEFEASKATKTALKSFLGWLPDTLPRVVLDLPSWGTEDAEAVAEGRPVSLAYDPLIWDAPVTSDMVYVRLPGPAGHRSRYDDDAIENIATHLEGIEAKTVFCVFRNIDMQANAASLLARLGNG